jgi:histidinol-phosphatase (PHP family)
MLANYHTHTTFCDGKNTPEEIVLYAIENGIKSIGFSGHGNTPFDLRYCMKDTSAYVSEVSRLKEKYRDKIQIYLGVEEDAYHPTDRSLFDYVIGSSHYFCVDGRYYPIDSSHEYFKKCLDLFNCDAVSMAHAYYRPFCRYINERRPDIIGHFDLITKYDELDRPIFLENKEYNKVAEHYITEASRSGSLFELNTGAIARELRTVPYPAENLLYVLKKENSGLILSSDSHRSDTLCFGFEEARKYLKDIGFNFVYTLYNGEFVRDYL